MNNKLTDAQETRQAYDWLSRHWEKQAYLEYYSARSLDEAVGLLEEYEPDAKVIAGGIDILSLLKNQVISIGTLIDLKSIPGLRYIRESAGNLTCGPLTLISDLQHSDLIKSKYPILQETAGLIASPQVRNMATVGGNLLQEVRCWYYRRSPTTGISFNCRRKTGNGQCYAINGQNQYHATLGGCECFGVCPSDLATAFMALDARVKTVNAKGEKTFAINNLYTSSGNILDKGDILTCIQIPEISPETKQRFLKFRVRKAIDFAVVSVAAVITQEKQTIKDIRLVLGGVSYKPYRAIQAEEVLKGKKITEKLVTEAGKAAVTEMTPLSNNGYKVPILEALVKRAILE